MAVCGMFIHDRAIDIPEYFVLKKIYVSLQHLIFLYIYIVYHCTCRLQNLLYV